LAVTIIAYITHWCPDCVRSLRILQRSGLPFVEIDIEKTPSAEDAMRAINGGSGKVPTILIDSPAGRRILIEPEDPELTAALRTAAQNDREMTAPS
jgi:mycoredoxin